MDDEDPKKAKRLKWTPRHRRKDFWDEDDVYYPHHRVGLFALLLRLICKIVDALSLRARKKRRKERREER